MLENTVESRSGGRSVRKSAFYSFYLEERKPCYYMRGGGLCTKCTGRLACEMSCWNNPYEVCYGDWAS